MKILPLKDQVYDLRAEVKRSGEKLLALRQDSEFSPRPMVMGGCDPASPMTAIKVDEQGRAPGPDYAEMNANLMLAYRALEDAAMRMGKLVQALDGGTSVYPR